MEACFFCWYFGPVTSVIGPCAIFREDPTSKKGAEFADMGLDGGGEVFTERLADAVCGGQVVLSETTWSTIQDHIPGQPQVTPHNNPSQRPNRRLMHAQISVPAYTLEEGCACRLTLVMSSW